MSPRSPLPNTNALNCPSASSGHCFIFRNTPFLRRMNDLHSPWVMLEPSRGSTSKSTDQTAMWSRASVHQPRGHKSLWSAVSPTGINEDHCQANHWAKLVPCPDMGPFAHWGFMVSRVEKKPKFLLSCTTKWQYFSKRYLLSAGVRSWDSQSSSSGISPSQQGWPDWGAQKASLLADAC